MTPQENDPKPSGRPEHSTEHPREEDKNVDRDGRERQPTEHTDKKPG